MPGECHALVVLLVIVVLLLLSALAPLLAVQHAQLRQRHVLAEAAPQTVRGPLEEARGRRPLREARGSGLVEEARVAARQPAAHLGLTHLRHALVLAHHAAVAHDDDAVDGLAEGGEEVQLVRGQHARLARQQLRDDAAEHLAANLIRKEGHEGQQQHIESGERRVRGSRGEAVPMCLSVCLSVCLTLPSSAEKTSSMR